MRDSERGDDGNEVRSRRNGITKQKIKRRWSVPLRIWEKASRQSEAA
jgi:hypothetical protein